MPNSIEEKARELLAAEYERCVGEGPYPTYARLARKGFGSFTLCSIRAIASALSPNMDHAVGGDRQKIASIVTHGSFYEGLSGQYGLMWEGERLPEQYATRAKAVDALNNLRTDAILALSATTPPVNQDAVREGVRAALRTKVEGIIRDWQRGLPSSRDLVDSIMLAIPALATPPLDNTGLDAATVERPDGAIENLTNFQQQADMHGEFVKVSRQALDETLAYVAALASGDRS